MKAKLILFLSAIFLAGVLVGYASCLFVPPRALLRSAASDNPQTMVRRLKQALDLTPEQVIQNEPELAALKNELRNIQKQSRSDYERCFRAAQPKIAEKLNDAQRERFERIIQKALERRERRFDRFRGREGVSG
jgi:hypothetical protein